MKRIPFVIIAIGTLFGGALLARSTSTPTTHGGPTLEITFSGMALFIKTNQGYRVVLPEMRAHDHYAYIRFPEDDLDVATFKESHRFTSGGRFFQWAPLKGGQLKIVPPRAIVNTPLDESGIADSLVHLKELAQGSDLNHEAYDQASPSVGKVAAQMTVNLGTLKRLELQSPWQSVRWQFKDGDEDSGVRVCGTSGIRWLVSLKQGTKKVSLVSSLPGNPKLSMNLHDGQTTEVIVGNSLLADIENPPSKERPETDPHFKLFYKMLKAPVAKEFIPVRTNDECGGAAAGEKKTRMGSDCLGGQWP